MKNTKALLLAEGLKAAAASHYNRFNVADVARAARCSRATVIARFGSTSNFRHAVVREALRMNNTFVLAQGLIDRHPVTATLGEEQRRIILESQL